MLATKNRQNKEGISKDVYTKNESYQDKCNSTSKKEKKEGGHAVSPRMQSDRKTGDLAIKLQKCWPINKMKTKEAKTKKPNK